MLPKAGKDGQGGDTVAVDTQSAVKLTDDKPALGARAVTPEATLTVVLGTEKDNVADTAGVPAAMEPNMVVPAAEIEWNPADVDWNKADPPEVFCEVKLSVGFVGLNIKPPFVNDELTDCKLVAVNDTAPRVVSGGNTGLNSFDMAAGKLLATDNDAEGVVLNTVEEGISPVDEVTLAPA